MLRADLLRPMKCRSVLLAAAFVFMLSGRSQAAPLCGADSLTNYLSLGSCSIGGATFSDFSLVTPLPTGATAVPADSVIVLPFSTTTSVGFQFLFDVTSTSFQLNELLFGYFASAAGFTDATLSMPGATASGDGVVTAIQDLCIGGAFTTGSLSDVPPRRMPTSPSRSTAISRSARRFRSRPFRCSASSTTLPSTED